jgi:protein-disulfide isomerase
MEDEIKKLISITSWFISLQAVTLAAFLGCAALVYVELQNLKQSFATVTASITSGGRQPQQDVANWKEYIRSHNPTEGGVTAAIIIEEFTDFQCPFCKSFNENIRSQLLAKYGNRIQIVFKHFPLEATHPARSWQPSPHNALCAKGCSDKLGTSSFPTRII